MSMPAEIERKVRQLDNDVQSIYEMLAGIAGTQQNHGNRLGELDSKLAGITGTQLRHGNRLDELDGKLAGISATQQRHGNRLTEIDGKLTDMDSKLDAVLTLLRGNRPDDTR